MLSNSEVKDVIQNALKNSMSYHEYITLVSDLIKEGKSTGHTQNDDMLNYSKLSESRMKRWDKTFKMSANDKEFLENQSKSITFLVVSEGWCGDAAHAMPILNKISEHATKIDLKIVLRDDNDELIQEFLTNGGKSIPKLIALDDNQEVLFTWGPRPAEATALTNAYKEKHGELTPEFKEDLQKWYNKDKGQGTVKDIIESLQAL